MFVVTTLSYGQLGTLIRENRVSLNNENLVFGNHYEPIEKYIQERLGGQGYVMAIRGRINPTSVQLLSTLDHGLQGDKVIIEAPVSQDDLLVFDVEGLDRAMDIINYGLPEEFVTEALDEAREHVTDGAIQIVCTPHISKSKSVRITSLNRDIDVSDAGITFVKLNGRGPNGT